MGLTCNIVYPNNSISQLELDVENGWHSVEGNAFYPMALFIDGKLRQVESSSKHLMWYIEYEPAALYRKFENNGPTEEDHESYNQLVTNVLNTMQLKNQVQSVSVQNKHCVVQLKDGV